MKKAGGNNRGRKIKAAAAWMLTMALFTGCGADSPGSDIRAGEGYYQESANDGPYSYDGAGSFEVGGGVHEESVDEAPAAGAENVGIRDARKLIETVRLEVETKEFERMMSSLELGIEKLGGYVESMNTYNGSQYSGGSSRHADMTVRIPQAAMKEFLRTVSEAANVVSRSDKVEDVTLSYADMESRRNTLRTEQSRLLEFLNRAETVEEIITLEERLSDVRYQLESMESRLRIIDNLVDYSTVYLNVSEVQELTPMEEPGMWERVEEGFGESLEEIREAATDLCVWFLVRVPFIPLWAAVLAAVLLFCRCGKRRLQKKARTRETGEENVQK